jgi:hypothetical protein
MYCTGLYLPLRTTVYWGDVRLSHLNLAPGRQTGIRDFRLRQISALGTSGDAGLHHAASSTKSGQDCGRVRNSDQQSMTASPDIASHILDWTVQSMSPTNVSTAPALPALLPNRRSNPHPSSTPVRQSASPPVLLYRVTPLFPEHRLAEATNARQGFPTNLSTWSAGMARHRPRGQGLVQGGEGRPVDYWEVLH